MPYIIHSIVTKYVGNIIKFVIARKKKNMVEIEEEPKDLEENDIQM